MTAIVIKKGYIIIYSSLCILHLQDSIAKKIKTICTYKVDQEWGRHIMLTCNIDHGETIAVEKTHAVVYLNKILFCCRNCVKLTSSKVVCL